MKSVGIVRNYIKKGDDTVMKLYKELITPENVIPPNSELIMESGNREELKRKAETLAQEHGLLEYMWSFEGNDRGYTELLVKNKYRFVIKP